MLAAYIDESERDEAFYFLGALVCNQAQHDFIISTFDAILESHMKAFPTITTDSEFHAYDLMSGKRDWKGIPMRLRFGIYRSALRAIADSGACVHLEGIDVEKQRARGYPVLTPARELALSHLFERINGCAASKSETVYVYADDHHTKEVSRSNFTSYQAWGTYGYRSSRLESIHPQVGFHDSRLTRLLQAADLVTYLYNRRQTVKETDVRAQEQKLLMWREIWPAVCRGGARVWP